MCLITKDSIRIAERDIKCLKYIRVEGNNFWRPYFRYMEGPFKFNELVIPKEQVLINKEVPTITKNPIEHLKLREALDSTIIAVKVYKVVYGFHAYVFNESKFSDWDLTLKHSLKLCIIPKGSEYCIDLDNSEIVANKIIVFNSRWKYVKYRIKKLLRI